MRGKQTLASLVGEEVKRSHFVGVHAVYVPHECMYVLPA